MAKNNILELILKLKDEASSGLSSARGAVNKFGDAIISLKGAIAGAGVGLFVKSIVEASTESKQALMGLNNALAANGRYTPEFSQKLQQQATALQKVTNFEDDATLAAVKMMVPFRKIGTEEIPRAMKVMQDMAAFAGGDMNAAVSDLTMSTEGMTRGLKKYGVNISETQAKAIGFTGILTLLEQRVGGQAEALRKASGPWIALKNTIGDLKEAMGDIVGTVLMPAAEASNQLIQEISAKLNAFKESAEFGPWARNLALDIVSALEITGKVIIGYLELWRVATIAAGKFLETYGTLATKYNQIKLIGPPGMHKSKIIEDLKLAKELQQAGKIMTEAEKINLVELGNLLSKGMISLKKFAEEKAKIIGNESNTPKPKNNMSKNFDIPGEEKKPGPEEKSVWNPEDQAAAYAAALADTNKFYLELDKANAEADQAERERILEKSALYEQAQNSLNDYYEMRRNWIEELDKKHKAAEKAKLERERYSAEMMGDIFGMAYELSGKKMKAFFVAQKAMALAQVIINTHLAVMAMEGQTGLLGLPLAPLIYAQGAMAAATIAAQTAQGFAHGGKILGYSPSSAADNIPIRATAGEYVQPVAAVKYYGEQVMEGMRRMVLPRELFEGFTPQMPARRPASMGFASGGQVTSGAGRSAGDINIINIMDPSTVAGLMDSPEVEGAVLNLISRRGPAVKRILGSN